MILPLAYCTKFHFFIYSSGGESLLGDKTTTIAPNPGCIAGVGGGGVLYLPDLFLNLAELVLYLKLFLGYLELKS